MLHFRERAPRSWLRRVLPVGKRDASAASSGARRPPGSSSAVRMVSCSPCPGTGRTFPYPLRRLPALMYNRTQPSSPHRLWSSWCGLRGIMQESSKLPRGERKEGLMIRELAQIVYRQVCALKEGIPDELDPPPTRCLGVGQTLCVPRTDTCAKASLPGAQATEASDAGRWLEPSTQALVVLFTQLAQRQMQTARAQEEIHEYGAHHHSSP